MVVPLKKQRTGKFFKPWDNPDEMNLEEVGSNYYDSGYQETVKNVSCKMWNVSIINLFNAVPQQKLYNCVHVANISFLKTKKNKLKQLRGQEEQEMSLAD